MIGLAVVGYSVGVSVVGDPVVGVADGISVGVSVMGDSVVGLPVMG